MQNREPIFTIENEGVIINPQAVLALYQAAFREVENSQTGDEQSGKRKEKSDLMRVIEELVMPYITPYQSNERILEKIAKAFTNWEIPSDPNEGVRRYTSSDGNVFSNCQTVANAVDACINTIKVDHVINGYFNTQDAQLREVYLNKIKKDWRFFQETLRSLENQESQKLIERLLADYRLAYETIVQDTQSCQQSLAKSLKSEPLDELLLAQKKIIDRQLTLLDIKQYNTNYRAQRNVKKDRNSMIDEIGFYQGNLSFVYDRLTMPTTVNLESGEVRSTNLEILARIPQRDATTWERFVNRIKNVLANILGKEPPGNIEKVGLWQNPKKHVKHTASVQELAKILPSKDENHH